MQARSRCAGLLCCRLQWPPLASKPASLRARAPAPLPLISTRSSESCFAAIARGTWELRLKLHHPHPPAAEPAGPLIHLPGWRNRGRHASGRRGQGSGGAGGHADAGPPQQPAAAGVCPSPVCGPAGVPAHCCPALAILWCCWQRPRTRRHRDERHARTASRGWRMWLGWAALIASGISARLPLQAVDTAKENQLAEADKMVTVLARLAKICQVSGQAGPSRAAGRQVPCRPKGGWPGAQRCAPASSAY